MVGSPKSGYEHLFRVLCLEQYPSHYKRSPGMYDRTDVLTLLPTEKTGSGVDEVLDLSTSAVGLNNRFVMYNVYMYKRTGNSHRNVVDFLSSLKVRTSPYPPLLLPPLSRSLVFFSSSSGHPPSRKQGFR